MSTKAETLLAKIQDSPAPDVDESVQGDQFLHNLNRHAEQLAKMIDWVDVAPQRLQKLIKLGQLDGDPKKAIAQLKKASAALGRAIVPITNVLDMYDYD